VSEPLPELNKECFFIAPIGEEGTETRERSDGVMEYIVAPAAQALGLVTVRADKIAKPGQITRQVIEHVVGAKTSVVDLTEANPNVYYELAVRHTAQLPTVLICQEGEKLPFDISQMRTIFFDYKSLKSAADCKEQIIDHLRQAINGEVESPIATSVSVQKLEQGTDPERVLAQVVDGFEEIRTLLHGLAAQRKPAPAIPDDLMMALLAAANTIRQEATIQAPQQQQKTPSRRVSTVLDWGGTSTLRDVADAAIYVADRRDEYIDELRRFVNESAIVPSKYLYWTPQGSSSWLALCKQRNYRYYHNSISHLKRQARDLVGVIGHEIGSGQVDLVSVGSGDGKKDNLLLRHFQRTLSPGEFISYYPVDISDTLIVEAVRNSTQGVLPIGSFRIKALIADFLKLSQLQPVYEERPNPNLFSVLGNTLGNANEDKLMESLAEAMLPGDLLLVEINVGTASIDDAFWHDPATLEHDFTPLSILGVDFDSAKLSYRQTEGESIVEGTHSIVASYEEATIDSRSIKDIRLSIVHSYHPEQFMLAMQERMSVRILWHRTSKSGDVCLILARRDDDTGMKGSSREIRLGEGK
jgi:uncharacterized SAM-dependent methyltransferase